MIVQGRHEGKHYDAVAVGKPNDRDIAVCEELGRRTVELAKRTFSKWDRYRRKALVS